MNSVSHWVKSIVTALFGLLSLAACQSFSLEQAQKARVETLSKAGQQELEVLLGEILVQENVSIPANVFAQNNELVIEKSATYVDGQYVEDAREYPTRIFKLYNYQGDCFLQDTKTQVNYLLKQIKCQPL